MSIKAYVAIEDSVANVMYGVWAGRAKELQAELEKLLVGGDTNAALDLASEVTLIGVVEDSRKEVEELLISAMLFGASQLVPIKDTGLSTGSIEVPQELGTALDQLTIMVEEDGSEQVRRAVRALVQDEVDTAYNKELEKSDSVSDLAARLNAAVLGTGKGMVNIGANLTTSRLASFGFLQQAMELNITTYQISEVLDERICPVCETMHGKTFNVVGENERVRQVLSTMDPQELRELAPWPSQDKKGVAWLRTQTEEELQAAGFGSPPFHPSCRGVLQRAGSVTSLTPLVSGSRSVSGGNVPEETVVGESMVSDYDKLKSRIDEVVDAVERDRLMTWLDSGDFLKVIDELAALVNV